MAVKVNTAPAFRINRAPETPLAPFGARESHATDAAEARDLAAVERGWSLGWARPPIWHRGHNPIQMAAHIARY